MCSITSVANEGPPGLTRQRLRSHQRQQLRPRHHQVHHIEKLTLARALYDKPESGLGKAHLFHCPTVSNMAVTWPTFADVALATPELRALFSEQSAQPFIGNGPLLAASFEIC
jgi:hypothetical protein